MARTYSSRLGRFTAVDPLSGDISNPQSLNRYVYALDDPINGADPTGMDDSISGWWWEFFGDQYGAWFPAGPSGWFNYAGPAGVPNQLDAAYARYDEAMAEQFMNQYMRDWLQQNPNTIPPGNVLGGAIVCATMIITVAQNPYLGVIVPIGCTFYAGSSVFSKSSIGAAQNSSWAWTFTKSFFGDFSLKPTGKAGKYGNCVENNRLDNALRSLGAAYGHPDVGIFLAMPRSWALVRQV